MKQPKLILVEGIPGSGKTTIAQFIQARLEAQGRQTALFLEGDLDHPADLESTACLTAGEYAGLQNEFPADADELAHWVARSGEDILLPYRKMEKTGLAPELLERLRSYEIYERPPEVFERVLLRRWQDFARQASQAKTVYIFECCFLQNPLTMLVGRCGLPAEHASGFILQLAQPLQALGTRLVYLQPGSVEATLQRVAAERPPEWLDFVIWYHTSQGYGKARGLEGFAGLVEFYQMRQAVELGLLGRLPLDSLYVADAGLEETQRQIASIL